MNNSNIKICNNSGMDLSFIHPWLIEYAKTGNTHVDIADLLKLERIEENGNVKILVDFLED